MDTSWETPKQAKHSVWNFFQRGKQDKDKARCKTCLKIQSYCNSTTNLMRHLKSCNRNEWEKLHADKKKRKNVSEANAPHQKKICTLLTQMIAMDMQPILWRILDFVIYYLILVEISTNLFATFSCNSKKVSCHCWDIK